MSMSSSRNFFSDPEEPSSTPMGAEEEQEDDSNTPAAQQQQDVLPVRAMPSKRNHHHSRSVSARSGGSVFSNVSTTNDRERIQEERVHTVFFPWNRRYKTWWGFTVFAAIFTVFFETYQVAFVTAGLPDMRSRAQIIEYFLISIFLIDIGVNFNLAFYSESSEIILDRKEIARNYLRAMFWVDFLGIFPFYPLALLCAGQLGQDTRVSQYLALLRLVRMVRLHRVRLLFQALQYSSKISLLWLTLTRNCAVALVWTHFNACALYFIAKEYHFGETNTWIGGVFTDLNEFERYVTSMYWSSVTFFTVGYGDYSPKNSAEMIWCIVYMFINTIILAWIIGSITLLIVKQDEKTGVYRETLQKLDQFSAMHHFDSELQKRLKMAIKLGFENKEVVDEQILQHFPSAVRRKVLRKLYMHSLARTSLMKGVRQQFVDAFLSACKLEIFSPGEELLQRGNVSSDLYLLVDGFVELRPIDDSKELGTSYHGTNISDTDHGSGGVKHLWAGHFINEIGFFTESPQTDTVRTMNVCKTLTMSRSAYRLICEDHPGSTGLILHNLLNKVKDLAREASRIHLPKRLEVLRAGSIFDPNDDPSNHSVEARQTVASVQTQSALATLEDLVQMHISKQKDDHTTRFLFAASRNDSATVSLMCDQGFDPDNADYDSRTGLMVAAMKGNTEVVKKLLDDYQANPNLVDVHGSSALYEAVKNGHEMAVDVLLKHHAKLSMSESLAASTLCQLVFDGDTRMLRRLLRSKIQVNAADYDKRTAAHIAAAEGNLVALKVLVEFGADLTVLDRWKNTIEDEAHKANAGPILDFLASLKGGHSSKRPLGVGSADLKTEITDQRLKTVKEEEAIKSSDVAEATDYVGTLKADNNKV